MTIGPPLHDQSEKLYRQVHPNWIQAGRASSQAFRPSAKDEGMLSVSRGSLTTPVKAMMLHRRKGLETAGTWSFTLGNAHDLGLDAYSDPVAGVIPDDAHAVVDFTALSGTEMRRRSQRLQALAVCEYLDAPPPPAG